MQEDNFGKLIKEIRKKYHLTQKDIADKYHVTYQAVSKWERGINLPDVTLMQEIGKDFNVSLDDMINGNLVNQKKKKNWLAVILIILCLLALSVLIIVVKDSGKKDFESQSITSSCKDYKISGIISYNSSKSLIYIPKIEYCGEDGKKVFHDINCTLYEKENDMIKMISTYEYLDKEITLEDFMKEVSFKVDNYSKICRSFHKNSFYLEIKAMDENNNPYFHEIPLTLGDDCN